MNKLQRVRRRVNGRSSFRKRLLANQTALSGVLTVGIALMAATPALSADRNWTGWDSGDFVEGANWGVFGFGNAPGAGDTATIGLLGVVTPAYLDQSHTVQSLTVEDGGGFTIRNGGALTADSISVRSLGRVTIDNGGTFSGHIGNTGGFVTNGGTVFGTASVSGGVFTNNGTVTGATSVTGGLLSNNGALQGALDVDGGVVINEAGGNVAGVTTIYDGDVTNGIVSGADFGTVVNYSTGVVNSNGFTNGSFGRTQKLVNYGSAVNRIGGSITTATNEAGTFTNSGSIVGALVVNGGTVNNNGTGLLNNGTVGGLTTITNDGVVTNSGALGAVNNSSSAGGNGYGFINENGGSAGGLINSGNAINQAGGTLASAQNEAGGFFANEGTVSGAIIANGGFVSNTGTVNGALDVNGGLVVNEGTVDGALDLDGGLVGNIGLIGGTADIASGSALFNAGVIQGATTNGGLLLTSGTLNGGLTNTGLAGIEGTINGMIVNSNMYDDTFVLMGDLSGNGTLDNQGTFTAWGGHTISGIDIENNGILNASNYSTNTNALKAAGSSATTLNIDGNITQGGGIVLGTYADTTTDQIHVTGDFSGADYDLGLYGLNYLDTPDERTLITVDGDFSAAIGDVYGLGNTANPLIVNSVRETGNSVILATALDMAPISGTLGGIYAAQAFTGITTNRFDGSYVTEVDGAQKGCSPGSYTRMNGGTFETTSTASSNGSGSATTNSDMTYGGVELGIDYGCFDLGENGGQVNFGILGGINSGKISENDTVAGIRYNGLNEFEQKYFGAYASYFAGPFFAELRTTYGQTSYDINQMRMASGFSTTVFDQNDFDADQYTASGYVGYNFDLDRLALTPSVGLSYSNSSFDDLRVASGSPAKIAFDDMDTFVGSIGLAASTAFVLEENKGTILPFLSGTYYNNFSDDPTAEYVSSAGIRTPITTSTVDSYGEVSVGFNYLAPAVTGNMRQLSSQLRADFPVGDDVSGAQVSLSLRVQF
ncbi:hypothetical protein [uncultured Martelella sp.]|uniref:autotransporter outer membrane beta-barrel domain-containing protein n=1 Tax=uncultured Martelella sp. TaxID=392331 RepID=UPI0029C69A9C|nr:hypothetical protein [uncultured Martelella sp.]